MGFSLNNDWDNILADEFAKDYFLRILSQVENEYETHIVYPPKSSIFASLTKTTFSALKVVVIGQDPYIHEGQANGLAFAVDCEKLPPSLVNIYKELASDMQIDLPVMNGNLDGWARQGVLLLNSSLTVRDGASNSHQYIGWQKFTDALIQKISDIKDNVVFVLWGSYAQSKAKLIGSRHLIIASPHPSPLSAYRGFFGSKPFTRINGQLVAWNKSPIDWQDKE